MQGRLSGSAAQCSGEALGALFGGDGTSVALVSPAGAGITYGQLSERVERLAGLLGSVGVRRADAVALALPNGVEFIELLLALAAVGAIAAPLNPAYTRDEFAFFMQEIDPRVLLVPAGELDSARGVAGSAAIVDVERRDGAAPALLVGGASLDRRTGFDPGQPDDAALILHTSGTTSRPKQVPLLQRNLMASARAIASFYELTPFDVSYCAMPLFHVHGLVASTFSALASGGSVVVPAPFVPRRFWRDTRAHAVTWFSAAPTLHRMILEKVDSEGAATSLRFVRSCSSALAPELMSKAEDIYGSPMVEAYGMTEASHQMTSNPLPPLTRLPGSVGVPTGTEVRLVDRNLGFLAHGSGEVVIRGPGVTPGYRNNPEANAEAFVDGWFRTGDHGRFEDGYLRLEGRLKEMILRGGENIAPAEIEEVLLGHAAVADVACFGIEDVKYGEKVAAAVSLRADADERELLAYCRSRLAAFKVPSVIYVLPEIPRTPTGKLQRRRVAALVGSRAQ